MVTIGERIRQLREGKDMSLRELAKAIGVSAAFLSDVELGRRYPSDKHLDALVRALATPLEDLKKHDTRPPMRDLRRMTHSNPEYGYAFRRLIDRKISPQQLLEFVENQQNEEGDAEGDGDEE